MSNGCGRIKTIPLFISKGLTPFNLHIISAYIESPYASLDIKSGRITYWSSTVNKLNSKSCGMTKVLSKKL